MRIIVVGAGIAGLVAAREVAAAGHEVVVLDKGRSAGGRMATRRIAGARLDHGAQFFTARSETFQAQVDRWLADGSATVWCRGFGPSPDGHARHIGVGGMNALARTLVGGLDVRTGVRVDRIVADVDAGWAVDDLSADAVVLTAPVPQALALLGPTRALLDGADADALVDIAYDRTVAALVVLDRPSAVGPPGGLQLDDGPFSFVGDDQAKGISPLPAVTFHASPEVSEQLFDTDEARALERLVTEARPHLGGAEVLAAEIKRWRYARPRTTHPDPYLEVAPGLLLAGDAFAGAKVEGAYLSGLAAGRALASR